MRGRWEADEFSDSGAAEAGLRSRSAPLVIRCTLHDLWTRLLSSAKELPWRWIGTNASAAAGAFPIAR
jgi:hypothetical protein